jgi:hypothetical protein
MRFDTTLVRLNSLVFQRSLWPGQQAFREPLRWPLCRHAGASFLRIGFNVSRGGFIERLLEYG